MIGLFCCCEDLLYIITARCCHCMCYSSSGPSSDIPVYAYDMWIEEMTTVLKIYVYFNTGFDLLHELTSIAPVVCWLNAPALATAELMALTACSDTCGLTRKCYGGNFRRRLVYFSHCLPLCMGNGSPPSVRSSWNWKFLASAGCLPTPTGQAPSAALPGVSEHRRRK